MMKGMIVVRADRCVGCKTCEVACGVEHSETKSLATAIRERNPPRPRVKVERGAGFNVPLQCRQCENAPCVAICPTNALRRKDKDSPVLIDQALCIGCKWCILACPIGVIRMDDESHAIVKCDQCFERLERGQPPACVAACPTHALRFKNMDAVTAEKREAYLVQIQRATEEAKK
jgi:anaerobic carbon-monoxide dehydrogenase iron sulfur subunit